MKLSGKVRLLGYSLLIIIIFFSGFMVVPAFAYPSDRVYPGVRLGRQDVGGYTRDQLQSLFLETNNDLNTTGVGLSWQKKIVWQGTLGDLGLSVDIEKSVAQLMAAGRQGSLIRRFRDRWLANQGRVTVSGPELKLDIARLEGVARNLETTLGRSPVNARFVFSGGMVKIIPGKDGLALGTRTLETLLRGLSSPYPSTLPLKITPISPRVTTATLENMGVTGLLASYSTYFDLGLKERTANIQLAANVLDGQMIAPGEVFSFNEAVGPRSGEAGYEKALVIKGNRFVPDLGGGVCQVSSTLYNAVLKANLPPVERRRHSLGVSYVPPGLDATVSYGYIDLKFANNSGGYLVLKSDVVKNKLTIKIFGKAENLPVVEIINRVTGILPAPITTIQDIALLPGQEVVEQHAKDGYRTLVERLVRRDGQLVAREIISQDTYPPTPLIQRVGPEPVLPDSPSVEGNVPAAVEDTVTEEEVLEVSGGG